MDRGNTVPERPNRSVPESILEEARKLEIEGLVALHGGKYPQARDIFGKQYDLYFETQSKVNRPIHKGSPLHNLGLALFYLKNVDKSVYNFLLAYVEDTLNTNYDSEDDADRAPAASMLRDIFLFNLRFLRDIKSASLRAKANGMWNKARDPKTILAPVAEKLKFNLAELSAYCGRIPQIGKVAVGFPQPRENRVFIGTNYDVNIGIIPLVKEGIAFKNLAGGRQYAPVVVLDVIVPPRATHDLSLLLLHTCGYAIVDVSHPGGQFVEIERARDYGVEVLLVRQAAMPINRRRPPHISEMISTLGYPVEYYFDPRELISITRKFLP